MSGPSRSSGPSRTSRPSRSSGPSRPRAERSLTPAEQEAVRFFRQIFGG
jgi:hypothetical protein